MQRDDRLFFIIGVGLTIVVGGIAAVLWFASTITGTPPERARVEVRPVVRSTPAVVPARAEVSPAPQRSAGDSDQLVRSIVARLSAHPAVASLLVGDGFVRRFVAAVEAIAGGYSPRDELEFLRPNRPFIVREDEVAGLVIAAGSYRRFDLATDVFTSLDTPGMVELYRQLKPQIDQVHRELAWTDVDFDDLFREAIDHLLQVEVPSGALPVERRTISYAFADDCLERLSDAQRQLLRMGPRNARRVQAKLRELRVEFGWPEPSTGETAVPALVTDPTGDEQPLDDTLRVAETDEQLPAEAGSPSGDPSPVIDLSSKTATSDLPRAGLEASTAARQQVTIPAD
jgi:hypothetical protein